MRKVRDFSGWQRSDGANADESLAKLPLLTGADGISDWRTERVALEFQPPADSDRHAKTSRVDSFARKLNFHLENLLQLPIKEASLYVRNRARTVLQRVRRATWRGLYDLRFQISDGKLRNQGDILFLAARAYCPRPYSGRAALFEAYKRGAWDSPFSWMELAARLEVYRIPGYHDSILGEPEVEILTSKLNHCRCEAQERTN
jgi:thioesterase domain-containing protein